MATIALIVIGGIYTAAHLPRHVPEGPTIGLLAAAALLLAVNIVLLAGIENFAWSMFRLVAGWVFAAYIVIAGMLEYVFVYDHTRGTQLVILTADARRLRGQHPAAARLQRRALSGP